jgi:hypothetical protein
MIIIIPLKIYNIYKIILALPNFDQAPPLTYTWLIFIFATFQKGTDPLTMSYFINFGNKFLNKYE